MTESTPLADALRRQPALGPTLQQVRPVTLSDPLAVAEHWVGSAGAILGGVLVGWGVVRVLLRPLWDDLIFASIKRKKPDVENFMRTEIFPRDIALREEMNRVLAGAVAVANKNADAIALIAAEQRAGSIVQAGIPRIEANMEAFTDALTALSQDVRDSNTISREHGEKIASLSALIGEETPGRRHHTRRATDPQLLDPPDEEPA